MGQYFQLSVSPRMCFSMVLVKSQLEYCVKNSESNEHLLKVAIIGEAQLGVSPGLCFTVV